MDSFPTIAVVSILVLFLANSIQTEAQLSPTFYDATCPRALDTIRTSIRRAVSRERRMAASLIRLHFHDCFVQGCDGSVLLDQTSTIQSEKTALANNNSARGFEVIEAAKLEVEKICPGVVSCADILSVAARDASVAVGGPTWQVKLGRRDSTTASRSAADSNLPSPFANLGDLITKFQNKGLSPRDMVALSGSHTIGQAQCFVFRNRVYSNGTDIDAGFASTRRRQCPSAIGNGDSNLAPLDLVTPNSFDNNYFKNLMRKKGLLISDQVLFSGGSTDSIVAEYSRNPGTFLADFASAMVKMGDIEPLTGTSGIIRKVCSAVN
ncbi:lignin-forming anionic peroxidase-like [Coffea eugenioides]|uniref:lignin-forming anionic peroxidase-like n=1 Tax=Coffea eugenioides TaxID=49369 RepID=UPI000F60AE18|nr:lignin-forming anionic peroxidase-like [Coffea eugenioides]